MNNLIDAIEAGRLLNLQPDSVRELFHTGRITGRRFGRSIMLDLASVERYAKTRRPAGRPAKK